MEMACFDDMGLYCLAMFEVSEVREGLENEREGVVIGRDGGLVHLGVDLNGVLVQLGMGEGPDEIVANEDMGSVELVEEVEGRAQEAQRLAGIDEVEGDGGVCMKVVEDDLGLDLVELGGRITGF